MILHIDMDAFYASVEDRVSQSRLDEAVDGIRQQFGRDRLSQGSELERTP